MDIAVRAPVEPKHENSAFLFSRKSHPVKYFKMLLSDSAGVRNGRRKVVKTRMSYYQWH